MSTLEASSRKQKQYRKSILLSEGDKDVKMHQHNLPLLSALFSLRMQERHCKDWPSTDES